MTKKEKQRPARAEPEAVGAHPPAQAERTGHRQRQRHRHEERVLGILAHLLGEASVHGERAVPRATRFVDGILSVAPRADGLRPLVPLLSGREVVLEHFHRAPTAADAARAVAKLGHVTDEWWHGLADAEERAAHRAARGWSALARAWHAAASQGTELELARWLATAWEADAKAEASPAHAAGAVTSPRVGEAGARSHEEPHVGGLEKTNACGLSAALRDVVNRRAPRPPILLLLSARPLLRGLAEGIGVPEGPVPGVRFAERPVLGDLLMVHLRGLPLGRPGYSVLRLMPTPETDEQERSGIRELLEDPGVVRSTKEALMEGMGTEVIPSTPGERRTLLERVREEARAEVEARLAEALEARAKEAEARAKEAEARAEAEARVRELEALVRALRATQDDGKG